MEGMPTDTQQGSGGRGSQISTPGPFLRQTPPAPGRCGPARPAAGSQPAAFYPFLCGSHDFFGWEIWPGPAQVL